ncbi:hypothetical protein WJX73_010720 [Symbiochloris irregularis]|uniref:RidA family protein n=1 Tax=Symbiochloris irregularis TaxID=706552 RepID=A0AAW1NTF6_9CHLO
MRTLAVLLMICASLAPALGQSLQSGAAPGIEVYDPQDGFSTASVAGDFLYMSSVPSSANQAVDTAVPEIMNFFNTTLTSLGASLENVVKVTVYLRDIGDFTTINSAYTPYFPEGPPVRSTIQAANPGSSPVAMDLVAYLPNGATASS